MVNVSKWRARTGSAIGGLNERSVSDTSIIQCGCGYIVYVC